MIKKTVILIVIIAIAAAAYQLGRLPARPNLPPTWTPEMVSRVITNGMPISEVVRILGTNYSLHLPISTVMVPPLRDEDKRASMLYRFPGFNISVESSFMAKGPLETHVCTMVRTWKEMKQEGHQGREKPNQSKDELANYYYHLLLEKREQIQSEATICVDDSVFMRSPDKPLIDDRPIRQGVSPK